MIDDKQPTDQTVRLYLAQEDKIEALRGEIAEMTTALAEFVRRLDVIDANGKNTRERLEQGVSNTAFKAWEKVQAMETVISEINGHLKNTDMLCDQQSKRQDRSDTFDSQVKVGMLVTFCFSIFATVMAFLWNYRGGHS